VAKLGVSPFIDCIVTSTDVGIKKPSGIMYQHILGCMGVRASNSIMVGNDLVADILGASQVGMTTVFYSCEMDDWNNLAKVEWQPNYVIERLPDLIPLLDQIQNST
jgi:putative hydrolase of the HAD superfamily